MSVQPVPGGAHAAYSDGELQATLRNLGAWWGLLTDGLDLTPVAGLLAEQAAILAKAVGDDAADEGEVAAGPADALGQLERLGRLAERGLKRGTLGRDAADPLLVSSLQLVSRAGRAFAAAGAYSSGSGTVAGLFTSNGGVPKLPVGTVAVGARGLGGDRQAERRHHGRPWQAVCLWSGDVVDRLAAEGHPIAPGQAGENISVRGLDWAAVRSGTRLTVGDGLVVEVSLPALPCVKNARWFVDRDFNRMHHEREPGVSRMYASVLHVGQVSVGDVVHLEG